MPAASLSYQLFPSASYNWRSSASTDACGEVTTKLNEWITAINSNASQSGYQVQLLKDHSSSTNADFYGHAVKLPGPGGDLYSIRYTSNSSNIQFHSGVGYSDNGSNGGYGTTTGDSQSDTSISYLTSAADANFMVAYGTEDNQEYFVLAYDIGAAAWRDMWIMAKTTDQRWATWHTDSSVVAGMFYNSVGYGRLTGITQSLQTNQPPFPMYNVFYNSTTSGYTANQQGCNAPADFWTGYATEMGNYVDLGGGKYLIAAGGASGLYLRWDS